MKGGIERKRAIGRVTLMAAQRRGHRFVEGGYGNQAGPPKGVAIFTGICVVILLVFYAYLAWVLLTSS
jgi:hypothetical protein